jgi:hypothetical protein
MSGDPSSSAESAVGPHRPPLWRAVLLVLAALALLSGLPYLRGLPPLAGSLVATVAFLLISLLLIQECARHPLRPLLDALGVVAAVGVWYGLGLLPARFPTAGPLLHAATGTSFLLACILAGRLLALIVRERNILLPVAIVAGLADIFTVFAGPTGQALRTAPKLVEKLSVAIPQVGSAAGPAGPAGMTHIATAGLGDFIFMTFFLVSAFRFGLRHRLTVWVIFAAAALGMAAVLLVPGLPAIPLLPFVALGFLLANAGAFRLSRVEKLQMGLVVGVLAALLALAGLLRHR